MNLPAIPSVTVQPESFPVVGVHSTEVMEAGSAPTLLQPVAFN